MTNVVALSPSACLLTFVLLLELFRCQNGGSYQLEEEEEYPGAVESEQDPSHKQKVPDETVVHGLVKKERKRRSKCGHKKERGGCNNKRREEMKKELTGKSKGNKDDNNKSKNTKRRRLISNRQKHNKANTQR